ncbi:MAG: lipid-binding SYLF domain-containing protein [Thermodesulfobacteriota bacterium]
MKFKRLTCLFIVTVFSLALAVPALSGVSLESVDASEKGAKKLNEAVRVVEEIIALNESGETGIPPRILRTAHGIAIIPGALKASLGIGGRYGKGALLVLREDGAWSAPIFITIAGGSLGFQVGAQSTDIILVFNEAKSIKGVSKGKFTFGVDATISAGDVGRHVEASTDERAKAEIYSYSMSRGLFVGVSLEGGVLDIDEKLNSDYYGLSAVDLIAGGSESVPAPASKLKRAVKGYVSK